MALLARSFFCAGCGDTESVKDFSGRRKLNIPSSTNIPMLLKSVISNVLERNGIIEADLE